MTVLYIYVLGEGIIRIRVQGSFFIIDVISTLINWNSPMAIAIFLNEDVNIHFSVVSSINRTSDGIFFRNA